MNNNKIIIGCIIFLCILIISFLIWLIPPNIPNDKLMFLDSKLMDAYTIKEMIKDDSTDKWLVNAKKTISVTEIKCSVYAILIVRMMANVNKRENIYSKDQFKDVIRKGIIGDDILLDNTLKYRPGLFLELIQHSKYDIILLSMIKISTDHLINIRKHFMTLFEQEKWDDIIEYYNEIKADSTSPDVSKSKRMAGIIFTFTSSSPLLFKKYIQDNAQQVDAPEPATMASPALQTPQRPAR